MPIASEPARPGLTRSDPGPDVVAAGLRERRAALDADVSLRGRAYGVALAGAIDGALGEVFAELDATENVALVALGSYARREMCPGSDVDVLLVHNFTKRRGADTVKVIAERLWYPLWDAGFVTGHGARTVKDSVALADAELDAHTPLLDIRFLAGNEALALELQAKARELAVRRRERILVALADAAGSRRLKPGPIAEMLEPDLKEGAGGLRDGHALEWAGWTFGEPGGCDALVARGYLAPEDRERMRRGEDVLLAARVALHRVASGRSDRLALQEQDAVAAALGHDDADALVRELATVGREIAWTTNDVWGRVRDGLAGPRGRTGSHDEILAEGVVLRDARVHVEAADDGSMPALRLLEAAAAAAERDAPFDRASLTRMRKLDDPAWDVWERAAFLRLLRAGHNAVPVFEALDYEGVIARLLPEWEHVRSRPQRNAYHRFTVDRHLLEAVAECAKLLDAGDNAPNGTSDVDVVVARACRRPELLLLGALLHDIAKGQPGDHSVVGAETAATIARRIGLDSEGREILVWLVRNHLLMAEVATRRDLSDASVADGVAAECSADAERLRLLYLLTIGDSHATGPAAWSPSKASLLRDLFIKAAAAIERGEASAVAADRRDEMAERLGAERAEALLSRMPEEYLLAFDADEMCTHEPLLEHDLAVRCTKADNRVTVTVVARDRPRLLATLAGALTVGGLNLLEANLFGTSDGLALDVFRASDPFERVDDGGARVVRLIEQALAGEIDLAGRVAERRRAYAPVAAAEPGPLLVTIDADASETDTVIEVDADDDLGLLYRLASALSDLTLDVRVAKVATLGRRVVDVFYVRDADGAKIDVDQAQHLHEALIAAIRE